MSRTRAALLKSKHVKAAPGQAEHDRKCWNIYIWESRSGKLRPNALQSVTVSPTITLLPMRALLGAVKHKNVGGSSTKMPSFLLISPRWHLRCSKLGGARKGHRRTTLSATLNGNFPCGFHDLDATVQKKQLSACHRFSTHATWTRQSDVHRSVDWTAKPRQAVPGGFDCQRRETFAITNKQEPVQRGSLTQSKSVQSLSSSAVFIDVLKVNALVMRAIFWENYFFLTAMRMEEKMKVRMSSPQKNK